MASVESDGIGGTTAAGDDEPPVAAVCVAAVSAIAWIGVVPDGAAEWAMAAPSVPALGEVTSIAGPGGGFGREPAASGAITSRGASDWAPGDPSLAAGSDAVGAAISVVRSGRADESPAEAAEPAA